MEKQSDLHELLPELTQSMKRIRIKRGLAELAQRRMKLFTNLQKDIYEGNKLNDFLYESKINSLCDVYKQKVFVIDLQTKKLLAELKK